MASGYDAGRFNLVLACAAAGAAAFALFAMPDTELLAGLDALGLVGFLLAPSGTATRIAAVGAAAALAFLLSWLSLRSCDPPHRKAEADVDNDNWPLSLLVAATGCERDPEDPFAALARGAERVDDCYELVDAQPAIIEPAPVIDDPRFSAQGPRELLARLPYSASPHDGQSATVHQLNAGLVPSEWPLPAGESEHQAEEMDDRLRNAIQDLKLVARRS
jgi:hypothetical protein